MEVFWLQNGNSRQSTTGFRRQSDVKLQSAFINVFTFMIGELMV